MTTSVYIACKMTGRDTYEQVRRAKFVSEVFARHGLEAISPVVEEQVTAEKGVTLNNTKDALRIFWSRDKELIRYKAHVVLLDHAEMKSFGMEREYCLSRGVLWKPTVILLAPGTSCSVAQFEDDAVFYSINEAAAYIQRKWGTPWKRILWRLEMLNRSLPLWLWDQAMQWR